MVGRLQARHVREARERVGGMLAVVEGRVGGGEGTRESRWSWVVSAQQWQRCEQKAKGKRRSLMEVTFEWSAGH